MIRVACSVKTHSFQLAEQLERLSLLDRFYTIYHAGKNPLIGSFNKRIDKEEISPKNIKTISWLAPLVRYYKNPFIINSIFDSFVSSNLSKEKDYKVFIGWSGMSLKSIKQAKKDGKTVVLERGSSHIRYQFDLLKDEFSRWGYAFKGDENVALQEEEEYELADYITIPSKFVEDTFIDKGISRSKLFKNNFGSNQYFSPTKSKREKFTVLYLGNLSIRKGIPYLFQALKQLQIDPSLVDVWFIGSVSEEIKKMAATFQQSNWKFFGHVKHAELADLISQCSIAVQPSLEEGLSMVIPQMMACGTPVIASSNSGGEDIITDGVNGLIVPIRSPGSIAEKINLVFYNRSILTDLSDNSLLYSKQFGSWIQYGDRYKAFLNQISN